MVAMCRPDVEALARDPQLSVDRITAALEARDFEAALALAIAHLVANKPLPIESVASILEGDPEPYILLHVVGKATGDRAAAVFDVIERGRIPYEDTIVAMLYVAWRTGDREAIRARVIRTLRRCLMDFGDEEVRALAALLVHELDDPNLTDAAELQDLERDEELERYIANAIEEPIEKLLGALPLEAPQKNAGFTVRAAEKPGRNEPCSCGSGKKFKKCCADKPDEKLASPLPGVAWDEYLRVGAPTMSLDDVELLAYDDLVRVDLSRLPDRPLALAFRRFSSVRDWPFAIRALDAMVARQHVAAEGYTLELLSEMLRANDLESAKAIRPRIDDDDDSPDLLTYELLTDPGTAIDRIERAAKLALADDSRVPEFNLAFAILRAYPALGVLVGRDLVDADNVLDAETMVIEIERARAMLDLPVDKRVNERWAKIEEAYVAEHQQRSDTRARAKRAGRGKAATVADPSAEARALRSSLVAENERATRLERELAAARDALVSASKPTAITSVRTGEADDALRQMRDRVQKLEALIREGNEERAELRKKLETTAKAPLSGKPAPAPSAPAVEEDPGDPVETRGRRICVPIWKPDAIRSLEALPAQVAALAIRTTGELAAADDGAWHQVKQARDMTSPVYMARVGIHHRLLFELREGRLEVLDVITRETLLHVLKRIRAR